MGQEEGRKDLSEENPPSSFLQPILNLDYLRLLDFIFCLGVTVSKLKFLFLDLIEI